MLKKVKAHYKTDILRKKFAYLKKEWGQGIGTQADADLLLTLIQDAEATVVPYVPEIREVVVEAKRLLSLMDYALSQAGFEKSEQPFMVFAGFTPDLSELNSHLKEHQVAEDGAVVLGGFLSNQPDVKKAIDTAMTLATEQNVVFLLTQDEKDALLDESWDRLSEGFIRRLLPVLSTQTTVFFAEESDMGIPLADIANGTVPNLSNKLFVHRTTDTLPDGFVFNEANQIMTLQHDMVTKLELKVGEGEGEDA